MAWGERHRPRAGREGEEGRRPPSLPVSGATGGGAFFPQVQTRCTWAQTRAGTCPSRTAPPPLPRSHLREVASSWGGQGRPSGASWTWPSSWAQTSPCPSWKPQQLWRQEGSGASAHCSSVPSCLLCGLGRALQGWPCRPQPAPPPGGHVGVHSRGLCLPLLSPEQLSLLRRETWLPPWTQAAGGLGLVLAGQLGSPWSLEGLGGTLALAGRVWMMSPSQQAGRKWGGSRGPLVAPGGPAHP